MRFLWFIPIFIVALIYWNRTLVVDQHPTPVTSSFQNGYQHLLMGSKLNLNTASQEDLEAIPGVGPSTASAVIRYRLRHGAFHSIGALQAVHGIGPKTVEKIAPFLIVSE